MWMAWKENYTLVRIRVNKEVWKVLKIHAIEQGLSVETFVGQLLEKWVKSSKIGGGRSHEEEPR
jgi:predicted HicB family RNase H-like nuclease